MRARRAFLFEAIVVSCGQVVAAHSESNIVIHPDAAAIARVTNRQTTIADASWWGFRADDATESLQAAINSPAKTVIVAYVGQPWIVRPLKLRSGLELVLAPGVVVLAKKGEFRGPGDALMRASDSSDVTIRGYGSLIRMRKADYQRPPYPRGEWRMGVSFNGCKHVRVMGLHIESTGGDGIYIGSGTGYRPSEEVVIRDCVCHDNHRQGISVVNARKLLIENCVLSGTSGTPPEAGIDFEPDLPAEELTDCVVRHCLFENNAGHAILVYLNPLTSKSRPVSIRFEGCVCRMTNSWPTQTPRGWAGMAVGTVRDNGPSGLVEFRDCVAENTGREGAKIYDKSAAGARVRFVNCSWKDSWISRAADHSGPRLPVLIELRDMERTTRPGGVEFLNCHIYDDRAVPAMGYQDATHKCPLYDVVGDIFVHGSRLGSRPIGDSAHGVRVKFHGAP